MTDLGIVRDLQSRRESLVSRLSPMARHQAFPRVYAMPAPVPSEPPPQPEPDLAELVRAAVAEFLGSTSGDEVIKRSIRVALSEKASDWRAKRLKDEKIAQMAAAYPVELVMNIAAQVTGIGFEALRGPHRFRAVAWPRHFAITLLHCARRDLSFAQIGKIFGGRDHTTIMNALKMSVERRSFPECEVWYADPRVVEILAGTEYALAQVSE